jgi:hypothetical protein
MEFLQGNAAQLPPVNDIIQFAPVRGIAELTHMSPPQKGERAAVLLGTIQAYMGPINNGQQQPFFVPNSDNKYMFCVGQSLRIAEFSALHAIIGNRSDADSKTTADEFKVCSSTSRRP